MDVIEENETNFLVRTPSGGIETKTKDSDLNKLLFGHNLTGLIEYGTEVWSSEGTKNQPTVTVVPDDNADKYELRVENAEPITLGEHRKTDLIDALAKVYEQDDARSVTPLVNLYDEIRDNQVRTRLIGKFAELFDCIEVVGEGWLINGHLLLTYENEFYHPSTESKKRGGGGVVSRGASSEAYSIRFGKVGEKFKRNITLEGVDYRLKDEEMTFIAMALWAIENTPDRR